MLAVSCTITRPWLRWCLECRVPRAQQAFTDNTSTARVGAKPWMTTRCLTPSPATNQNRDGFPRVAPC